jgi:hypothetical protein
MEGVEKKRMDHMNRAKILERQIREKAEAIEKLVRILL